MNILLISPPLESIDNGYAEVHKNILFPSLGLYYLREYARKNSDLFDIEILDFSETDFNKSIEITLEKKPDVIGMSCFTDRRSTVLKFVSYIKKIQNKNSAIKIILGGTHATLMYSQILKKYPVDFIVTNEGEVTFLELLNAIKNNSSIKDIKGVAFLLEGEIKYTGFRPPASDLDFIPYPKYSETEKFNINFTHYDDRFRFNGKKISELKTMSIITSRGCPFKCIYCSTANFWGRNVRFRSAENVFEEIKYLYECHNVEFINIIDDAFTLKKTRVIEICNKIIENNIKICWICETNVKTIDEEMIQIMKKSGCFAINYGVESGSPTILNNIKKGTVVKEIETAVLNTKKHGLLADIFLMVGNPGETFKTVKQTINLIKKIKPSSGGWGILTIFPGTELYELCKERNIIDDSYWLTDKSSPYYLYENSFIKQRIFLNMITAVFLFLQKRYKTYIRYKLLIWRDYIFEKSGIFISKKQGIKFLFNSKLRKNKIKYLSKHK